MYSLLCQKVFLKTSRRKHIQKLKILEHFDNSNGAEPNLENQNDDTENQPIRNGDTSNPPISFEGPVRGKIEKTGVKRKCLNGESSQGIIFSFVTLLRVRVIF